MIRRTMWVAWCIDFSEFAVFEKEIECLRYALDNNMQADQVPFGVGIRQYINNKGKT